MVHTGKGFGVNLGHIGCIAKEIIYKGKSAHAGGSPWSGSNALYAATCGINAANALRETFKESDIIRFHPIITEGGQIVNAIPERVKIESYVRGKTFEGILEANRRINQALSAGALALNCNVQIIDSPGYAPETNDKNLMSLFGEAMELALPGVPYSIKDEYNSGCSDMGDISAVMPSVQPHCAGAVGTAHGNDYYIEDSEMATVNSAKLQLSMLYLLLKDGAAKAKLVIEGFTPRFASISGYLAYVEGIFSDGDRITYNDDGTATVKI
jgi:metal-dependent amidase/aminoacylase/carboxypeptidase family protein